MEKDTEAMNVLKECIELMRKKGNDYQSPNSSVRQAMHYRRGVDTLFDVMNGKMLRMQSLLESSSSGNFESLEDSAKDLINYASFFVSWLRGGIDGQDVTRDMLNRIDGTPVKTLETKTSEPLLLQEGTK